jgi:uncharacterized protein (DUF3820 family)
MKMPFGRHRGRHIEDIPTGELQWVYRHIPVKKPGRGCMGCRGKGMTQELHLYIEEELAARKKASLVDRAQGQKQPVTQKGE